MKTDYTDASSPFRRIAFLLGFLPSIPLGFTYSIVYEILLCWLWTGKCSEALCERARTGEDESVAFMFPFNVWLYGWAFPEEKK